MRFSINWSLVYQLEGPHDAVDNLTIINGSGDQHLSHDLQGLLHIAAHDKLTFHFFCAYQSHLAAPSTRILSDSRDTVTTSSHPSSPLRLITKVQSPTCRRECPSVDPFTLENDKGKASER